MWCPQCGAEYREGHDRCASCDVDLEAERNKPTRRSWPVRSLLIVGVSVVLIAAVVVWHAWPSPSDHRLSLAASERACNAFAAHQSGQVSAGGSESVSNAIKINRHFNMGASAFLASVPKSQGLATCSVMGATDLPACGDITSGALKLSEVLVTADGSRYSNWCSASLPAP